MSNGKLVSLLIGAYAENPGNPQLKTFYENILNKGFIISPNARTLKVGPEIDWSGETDEVKLQGFFQSKPDWYDVGFLKRALQQALSVCRVVISSSGVTGTGVLIAPRLVLTNYHLLNFDNNNNILAKAKGLVLQFGCLTQEDGREAPGNVFKLDEPTPILQFSSTEKLDYVLLQVEESINSNPDIQPASWTVNNNLVPRMGINLLQHPEGDSMKLSISCDGITGVYPERGLIQYINQSAGGSSGSPCYNENWQLVALHHAERARYFGAIREGILFSAIHAEIKSFLK